MSSPPLSSPPRPRACSSGRSVRSPIPVPRLWSRFAGSSTFRSFAPALSHPGAADNPRRTLWRWSHPLAPRPMASNDHRQLCATTRQATTPGRPSLRALTCAPSCATGARNALQTTSAARSGSAFPLITGSVFLLGPTRLIIFARAVSTTP
jgi:hypothetical protein